LSRGKPLEAKTEHKSYRVKKKVMFILSSIYRAMVSIEGRVNKGNL
jgi:hypothetical protein